MTFDEQEILRRFHRAVVREIHARDPEHVNAPFTVAEIYQNLVPYRTHRDELGVEMNADYEHALLRLLAGEGDFLSIESSTARKEIREELETPNPNTGLYRDFAAADVRLNPDKLDVSFLDEIASERAADASEASAANPADGEILEEDMEEDVREGDAGEQEVAEDGYETLDVEPIGASLVSSGGDEAELASEEVPVEVSDDLEDVELEEDETVDLEGEGEEEDLPPFENCPWCREALPQQARVRFCPFCGSNVQLVPCPACGEELRLNWRFCIACGTEVKS
ncbi:MAG: zinc ribbon domain-containing protein [Gemmatimonadota bacterium]|jgi:hypothetical protein